jgi:hypothetical protein
MPLVETREDSCIPIIIDSGIVWVDYGPVVFPSHIGKVFHVKIVCLVLVVFGYIFSAYILLYFIVSYRFTQRGSFVYCCFSQHISLLTFLLQRMYS